MVRRIDAVASILGHFRAKLGVAVAEGDPLIVGEPFVGVLAEGLEEAEADFATGVGVEENQRAFAQALEAIEDE